MYINTDLISLVTNVSNVYVYKIIIYTNKKITNITHDVSEGGGGGGGGGVITYIFLIRMYPVKTKGEPKAGGRFSHKLPTQIRGK